MNSKQVARLAIVGFLLIGLASPAVAQSNNSTVASGGDNTVVAQLDETITIVSFNFDTENNSASVTLRADYSQSVKMCDMGAGGNSEGYSKIPCKSAVLDGGTNQLTISVTPSQGWLEFSIASANGQGSFKERTGGFRLTTNYQAGTVAIALVTGMLGGVGVVGVVAFMKLKKVKEQAEKLY
jgi:hypothetical protein